MSYGPGPSDRVFPRFYSARRRGLRRSSWWALSALLAVACSPGACEKRGEDARETSLGVGSAKALEAEATSAPEAPEAPVPDARSTLLFLGDSLTAGYGLAAAEAFPARVEEALKAEGFDAQWRVVNAGVSGDTTRGGLERLDWVFRTKPSVVFLCLGANDGLRGIEIAETERNLRGIIEGARARGARVALSGMRLPSNYGPDYAEKFAAIYPRLAREYDLPLLPFLIDKVALDARYTIADGIHPNAEGARLIAVDVWNFVKPLLKGSESPG
jgi:acyl-CoA thioesterase-1